VPKRRLQALGCSRIGFPIPICREQYLGDRQVEIYPGLRFAAPVI
jgi:hypothetical protein